MIRFTLQKKIYGDENKMTRQLVFLFFCSTSMSFFPLQVNGLIGSEN